MAVSELALLFESGVTINTDETLEPHHSFDGASTGTKLAPPVLRCGADDAFAKWSECAFFDADTDDCHPNMTRGVDEVSWSFNEVQNEFDGPESSWVQNRIKAIDIVLKPHRQETHNGKTENIISTLRHFSAIVTVHDGSGMPMQQEAQIRCHLVFSDTGEPVPASNGEAPLCGEVEKTTSGGGSCTLRLRVNALTYAHNRRAFALCIKAWMPMSENSCLWTCSDPIKAVARLPNMVKPLSTLEAPRTHSEVIGSASFEASPRSQQETRSTAVPKRTYDHIYVVECPDEPPITDGKEPGLEAIMPSSPTNSSTGSTGIIDELRSQAALLQYALAQQRKIMGEVAILRHESSVSAQVI